MGEIYESGVVVHSIQSATRCYCQSFIEQGELEPYWLLWTAAPKSLGSSFSKSPQWLFSSKKKTDMSKDIVMHLPNITEKNTLKWY